MSEFFLGEAPVIKWMALAAEAGLDTKDHWLHTAKCAVSNCDSPKGKTKFFCPPWVERHILGSI